MRTTKYKIDKRIQPPKPAIEGAHHAARYPFSVMEVGDSFKLPKDPERRIPMAAYIYGRRNNKKFMVRGNRIWRMA